MSADTSGEGSGRQRRCQAGFRVTQIGAHHRPVRGLTKKFDKRATTPRDLVDHVGVRRQLGARGTVRIKSTIRSRDENSLGVRPGYGSAAHDAHAGMDHWYML